MSEVSNERKDENTRRVKPSELAQINTLILPPDEKQVGGDHYKTKGIQPIEYIKANELDFFQGNVVKYVTRYKEKNGAEDIKKAIHYCEMILGHIEAEKEKAPIEEGSGVPDLRNHKEWTD